VRVLQEFDDFLEFDLGLVSTRDIRESHFRRISGEELRLGLSEGERFAAACLQLTQQEDPEPEDDHPREGRDEESCDPYRR
jgi:hypothetical protein